MAIKTYRKDYRTSLSANFKVNEFSCQGKGCCSKTTIDDGLVKILQKIRDHFGASVTINSGYRCATHNKKIGGSSGSYHTQGMAADIVVTGVKPAEVAKYAESIGVLGIGLYETAKDGFFVHVDTRAKKSFWYGQGQAKRTTFGGESPVMKWQKAAIADGFKLTADGVFGSNSEAVAKKAICKKQLIGYKYRNLTKIVQKAVGVTADGKFGNSTKKAVIAYQKKNGLVADGSVGFNTWKKILDV